MAKAKLYSFTDHSTTPSSTVFVCATSQQAAADAVARPLSHIKKYMSVHTDAQMLNRFKHLKIGQFEKKSNAPTSTDNGMSMRDLDRIAAVGILTSAHIALQQCSMGGEMKERLLEVIGDIGDLRSDLREQLEDTYAGR